ncbi:MAG: hypothetical protein HYY11_09355 [Candidatus Methylomirabilis oxyfera]|nr:hypothetical protein [Candidatus Methylomirabilis oxyfera]
MEALYAGWVSHPFLVVGMITSLYALLVIGVVAYSIFGLPEGQVRRVERPAAKVAPKAAPVEELRKAA